tara:strand:+ start:5691 stop:5966 length:276 start_codon:yes stop_codon:yes gene_type:complete
MADTEGQDWFSTAANAVLGVFDRGLDYFENRDNAKAMASSNNTSTSVPVATGAGGTWSNPYVSSGSFDTQKTMLIVSVLGVALTAFALFRK